MGNEALLEMLDSDAAAEMLEWGIETAKSLARHAEEPDDVDADPEISTRLKALRQAIRSIGNWAAGKYVNPADRIQLRDKLLEHFKVILGEEARLPSADKMDAMLNQVEDARFTPHQLIRELKRLLEEPG